MDVNLKVQIKNLRDPDLELIGSMLMNSIIPRPYQWDEVEQTFALRLDRLRNESVEKKKKFGLIPNWEYELVSSNFTVTKVHSIDVELFRNDPQVSDDYFWSIARDRDDSMLVVSLISQILRLQIDNASMLEIVDVEDPPSRPRVTRSLKPSIDADGVRQFQILQLR
jgi:hypothetical protein